MKLRGTSGPWELQSHEFPGGTTAFYLPGAISRNESEANRRLMQASPDILEMLHRFTFVCAPFLDTFPEGSAMLRSAKKLVADHTAR